jgi:chitodextrinase
MPVRPDQRWYQSGAFEALGLLGQLLVAAPNVGLLPAAADAWLRIGGLSLVTAYVCVLLVRAYLPDLVLEASAKPPAVAEPATAVAARSPVGAQSGWLGRSTSGSMARSPAGSPTGSPGRSPAGSPAGPSGSPVGPSGSPTGSSGSPVGPSGSPAGEPVPGAVTAFQIRLRAGNWRVVGPVLLVVILVAGFSLFGSRLLGLSDNAAPPAPSNLRAIGATAQQVDLTWDPVTDTSGVKEYRIVRADNGRQRIAVTNRFYDTMDVAAGARYAYTVLAIDGAGNVSPPSATVTVQTPVFDSAACAIDSTAPIAPGNLRATSVTATAVTLEWDPATDAGTCGLAGYLLFRDGEDTGISVAGTTVTEDGLEPNESYVYSIVARDNARNDSAASAELNVATLARPVVGQNPCEITAPRNLTRTGKSDTTVSLAWEPPTEDCDQIEEYLVYRGATLVGQTADTSFTVTNLMPSTTYVFRVRAYSSDEETSPSSNYHSVTTAPPPDTTPPTVPGSLTVTNRNPAEVHLNWTASTDTGGSGFKEYKIFRDGSLVVGTTSISYVLPMSPSTSYTVEVRAADHAGNISAPAIKNFTTAPSGLPALAISGTVLFGQNFSFNGSNVDPNSTVTVTIDTTTLPLAVTSDGTGAFLGTVGLDPTPVGQVTGTTFVLAAGPHTLTISVNCTCSNGTQSIPFTVSP